LTRSLEDLAPDALPSIEAFVRRRLATATAPLVVGLCGAQGSGKSTIASALAERIPDTVVLSLDDLYIPKARRGGAHRLLETRGVPGTHDTALGEAVLDAFRNGRPFVLPRFDKATDDRFPASGWPHVANVRLMIFEGWCVGAEPQSPADLVEPVNALERDEDTDGSWRRLVNTALGGAYRNLFELDALVLLAAPGFEVVRRWRTQQEHALAADIAAGRRMGRAMSDGEVDRFIQYYQRLTQHILREMPSRADLVVRLDADRKVVA
jgi:D-glycerate 3-kinase